MDFDILPARTPTDLAAIKALFTTYVASLGIDLSFQNYASEYSNLPGAYSPPTGELLLAKTLDTDQILGCVALRALPGVGTGCCEMKRLYVTSAGRGRGVGKALAVAAIQTARALGYDEMRLDTLASMAAAKRLYGQLGFAECAVYYETPVAGTVFMAKKL